MVSYNKFFVIEYQVCHSAHYSTKYFLYSTPVVTMCIGLTYFVEYVIQSFKIHLRKYQMEFYVCNSYFTKGGIIM